MEKINQKNFYILNFYISKCKIRNVRVEQHNLLSKTFGTIFHIIFCYLLHIYALHITQSKRSLTYVLCSKQQLQKSVGINATKSSNPFRFFAVIQIIYTRSSRTCLLKAPNESLSRFPRGIVLILQINTLSLISSKL